MHPLAYLGRAEESRPRYGKDSAMEFANERIERKYRHFAQLDPKHELELDGTFMDHLADAIRASSPSERQQALDKAMEACENALDDVL
jgi:hypothetical protein